MVVFVCSPLAGDVETNIELAKELCHSAASNGMTPVAPHLLFTQFLDEDNPQERLAGLECGLALLERCDVLFWYSPTGKVSSGMAMEIAAATEWGIPVVHLEKPVIHMWAHNDSKEVGDSTPNDAGWSTGLR